MGKFDGVWIASDFDNTLVYTETALKTDGVLPPLSRANREAIEYFMAQGGLFSVATGRALPSFRPLAPTVPMNAPTILFNGAAIYDFSRETYCYTAFLPESIRGFIDELLRVMPGLTFEIYHDDNSIHTVNPSELSRNHLHLTHLPSVEVSGMAEVPSPISKILFEGENEQLQHVKQQIEALSRGAYELAFSGSLLLELTARGANKGGMAKKLAELLHVRPENVYCVGDHANDIAMLRVSHIPYAPANALPAVRALPGVHVLPDARADAIAAMIAELDTYY
jgi:Cof subfamily protein (haloacid dehalogenase superfamily)